LNITVLGFTQVGLKTINFQPAQMFIKITDLGLNDNPHLRKTNVIGCFL